MKQKEVVDLETLYESIYSGYIEDDDKKEDKDTESDNKENEEKESNSDNEKKESSNDSKSDNDDEKESDDDSKSDGPNKSLRSKVKALQKQYNDIIIAAVETHVEDAIEQALTDSDGAFGENIADIIDNAFCYLKGKVLTELGVEAKQDMAPMGEPQADEPQMGEVEVVPTETESPQETSNNETEQENEPEQEEEKVQESARKKFRNSAGSVKKKFIDGGKTKRFLKGSEKKFDTQKYIKGHIETDDLEDDTEDDMK